MSDSVYRPSGKRKGTHLRGVELTERIERDKRVWRDKLKFLHGHYHCPEHCAAPLASLVYGKRQVENADMIWTAPTATLTCTQGHVTEEVLS